jgi:terminal uridylyltransferase
VKVIKDLQDMLKKLDAMSNLVPITTAKVPILKFYHTPSELEGDISIYNTLGQQNTKLLRAYAEIDPRAKVCVHCDNSIGICCEIDVLSIVSPGTNEFEH